MGASVEVLNASHPASRRAIVLAIAAAATAAAANTNSRCITHQEESTFCDRRHSGTRCAAITPSPEPQEITRGQPKENDDD
jgi:hypothetical protein